MPGFDQIFGVVRYLGARLASALAFALACGVPIYLDATDAGFTLDPGVQKFLIVAAAVVMVFGLVGRTLTDWLGKTPSGDQPDPVDRRGE